MRRIMGAIAVAGALAALPGYAQDDQASPETIRKAVGQLPAYAKLYPGATPDPQDVRIDDTDPKAIEVHVAFIAKDPLPKVIAHYRRKLKATGGHYEEIEEPGDLLSQYLQVANAKGVDLVTVVTEPGPDDANPTQGSISVVRVIGKLPSPPAATGPASPQAPTPNGGAKPSP